ncbi:hypothetical protein CEE44_02040 [Candidatus Woesearchaeota archaeon B3_Woes]|nr:MAG: hypothetical protein CEE44_02040 [Candidatus Woesearchaeota archaeon B3_Woes]
MNRKQWYVLAIVSFLLGNFFIYLDINNGFLPLPSIGNPCNFEERLLLEKYNAGEITIEEYREKIKDGQLDKYDVTCILGGEMYEPFIYLFNLLWIVFLILAWLEPKKQH